MLYVESGLNESFVYSEVENLTDWTITIQGKIGREKLTEVVPMTITTVSEKRYNFEWTAPTVLENKEYTYTIKSTNIIIDNDNEYFCH